MFFGPDSRAAFATRRREENYSAVCRSAWSGARGMVRCCSIRMRRSRAPSEQYSIGLPNSARPGKSGCGCAPRACHSLSANGPHILCGGRRLPIMRSIKCSPIRYMLALTSLWPDPAGALRRRTRGGSQAHPPPAHGAMAGAAGQPPCGFHRLGNPPSQSITAGQ